jgi:hypothetical protein
MRRPSDIAEAWLGAAVAAGLVIGVPVVGVATAMALQGPALETARQQTAERHLTTAVLVESSRQESSDTSSEASDGAGTVPVTVRWSTPGGVERTAETRVPEGLAAGAPTRIWTDAQGNLADQPMSVSQAQTAALAGGVAAAAGASGLVLLVRGGVSWRLNGRRMERWESEWAEVEPDWSHRKRA